jgi:hypothetical protein
MLYTPNITMTHKSDAPASTGTVVCTLLLAASLAVAPDTSHGQRWTTTLPVVAVSGTGTSARPLTATEADIQTATKMMVVYSHAVPYHRADVPWDSIRTVVAAEGRRWLQVARQHHIRGLHLEPSGHVGVAAGDEAYAQAQIAARLATPGLSFGDRAFVLRTGVNAFADAQVPERLPIAERYLAQLDALGDSAATWQFEAHKTLLEIYYILGRSADVVRHGTRTCQRVSAMPFAHRAMFYAFDEVYGPTVEALAAQPNARTKIEEVSRLIRATALPSPQLVAFDSAYYDLGRGYRSTAERWIAGNAKLGTSAAPLVGHYWLNQPAIQTRRTSRTTGTFGAELVNASLAPKDGPIPVSIADGKIRLIEVANLGCAPCVLQLYAMERFKQQYPGIEPIMLTWTSGSAANRLIDAEEEVRALRKYFIDEAKLTYPIGIWAGKKVRNEDGGLTPLPPAYLDHDYPLFGKPMTYVVDGQGTIRRIFSGYSRNIERQMRQTIEFLLREAADSRRTSAEPSAVVHP